MAGTPPVFQGIWYIQYPDEHKDNVLKLDEDLEGAPNVRRSLANRATVFWQTGRALKWFNEYGQFYTGNIGEDKLGWVVEYQLVGPPEKEESGTIRFLDASQSVLVSQGAGSPKKYRLIRGVTTSLPDDGRMIYREEKKKKRPVTAKKKKRRK